MAKDALRTMIVIQEDVPKLLNVNQRVLKVGPVAMMVIVWMVNAVGRLHVASLVSGIINVQQGVVPTISYVKRSYQMAKDALRTMIVIQEDVTNFSSAKIS